MGKLKPIFHGIKSLTIVFNNLIFIGWKRNVIPMCQHVAIDETQLPRIISINSMIYVLIVHIYWISNRFYRKFERKNHFNIILMFHHVKQLKRSEQIDHHVKINESIRNHWILLQQEIKQEYNFIGKIFFEIVRQEKRICSVLLKTIDISVLFN